jgi:electron transport complex protein RnfA
LGTLLLPAMTGHSLGETFVAAAALGTGFAIVLVSFIALAARITEQEVPNAFRLAPITLISAGLTALALMGFTGLLRS